jgi:hypothetical protein
MSRTEITREDILSLEDYAAVRDARRTEMIARKRNRRLEVGPFATLYFENYDTMWLQVHEMLRAEGGGEGQIADELAAYNPLIPKGDELVATFMLEIADEARRQRLLAVLGGIETTVGLRLGDQIIRAVAEDDVERTTDAGKTSAVHFLHFPFTPAQIAAFRDPAVDCALAIEHENYRHMAGLPPPVRAELAGDFA